MYLDGSRKSKHAELASFLIDAVEVFFYARGISTLMVISGDEPHNNISQYEALYLGETLQITKHCDRSKGVAI